MYFKDFYHSFHFYTKQEYEDTLVSDSLISMFQDELVKEIPP